MSTFDFLIIGAGSAGSVLASRLTEDAGVTVGVIEAGGSDLSLFVHMPSALSIPMNTKRFNWGYETEPEPGLDGRVMNCPRGRGWGGSSSVNGMVYIRGHAMDFDTWVEMGARGWSYADVLPYFRKAETRAAGGDEYRGGEGPLHTQYGRLKNPLYRAFIEAAKAAGYAETDDVNGYRQEGFGRMDMTVHNGRRWSTAMAYLRPALKRPNLQLFSNALVKRIVFEGRRAVGVVIERGGVETVLSARREVILSAGAIGSPHILKLSGIGPGAELAAHGIDVVADRPGVGENLQDHLEFYFQQACLEPISLYKHLSLLGKARIGVEWLLTQKGLGATNHFETCGFIRSAAGVPYPDIQYHFLPVAIRLA
jgi:choline dehydrogenase